MSKERNDRLQNSAKSHIEEEGRGARESDDESDGGSRALEGMRLTARTNTAPCANRQRSVPNAHPVMQVKPTDWLVHRRPTDAGTQPLYAPGDDRVSTLPRAVADIIGRVSV